MATTSPITDQHVRDFEEKGFFVLENVLPSADLELLRNCCTRAIELVDADMDAKGVEVFGLTHKGKRYFIGDAHKRVPELKQLLLADYMAEICRHTIGDTAYMFLDQFVVKAADKGMKFAWHQDSGYIPYDHKPYLTTWITLDDVSEENGTVYMLPYERGGGKERILHQQEAGTNDMVGYHGDDPGDPVIAPAGSIAVFSSLCFHRSGANMTNKPRRVLVAQYSPEIIMNEEGTQPRHSGIPFLQDGRIVAERDTDPTANA
jgi:ectoine hydroxylase-related dioxygenase (phytanoyl-CoA dioxygenase family)